MLSIRSFVWFPKIKQEKQVKNDEIEVGKKFQAVEGVHI